MKTDIILDWEEITRKITVHGGWKQTFPKQLKALFISRNLTNNNGSQERKTETESICRENFSTAETKHRFYVDTERATLKMNIYRRRDFILKSCYN